MFVSGDYEVNGKSKWYTVKCLTCRTGCGFESLHTAASNRSVVFASGNRWNMEQRCNGNWQGKTWCLGKLDAVLLCKPYTLHKLKRK
jgi:hypothetical protein